MRATQKAHGCRYRHTHNLDMSMATEHHTKPLHTTTTPHHTMIPTQVHDKHPRGQNYWKGLGLPLDRFTIDQAPSGPSDA